MKRFIIYALAAAMLMSIPAQAEQFKATAYCGCRKCCGRWAKYHRTASGTTPEEGRTIAVDKRVIPLWTHVLVDGVEYIAEDTGVRGNRIDIYFNSHSDALEYGVKWVEVEIKEDEEDDTERTEEIPGSAGAPEGEP